MDNDSPRISDEPPSQEMVDDWIWRALALSLYELDDDEDDEDDDEEEGITNLIEKTRSNYTVTVVMGINRESISGDEHDVVGVANPVGGGGALLFSASDSRDYCGTDDLGIHDHLSVKIANLLIDDRWNLCQISGTTITNHRPDLLCRDDIAAIIERLVVTGGLTWDDVGDEAASTDEFLNQSYREIAS